jgi:hypothetical protein
MPKNHIPKLSPFLEGIARNFDFAGSIDHLSPPLENDKDPILNDWQAVASDYQDSLKIMNEVLNGNKKNHYNSANGTLNK